MRRVTAGSSMQTVTATLWRRLQEGGFILLTTLAICLFVSLITYNEADPGWSHAGVQSTIRNATGRVGAWFSDLFLYLFGYIAYLFPAMIAYSGIQLFQNRFELGQFHRLLWVLRVSGFILAVVSGCGLAGLSLLENRMPVGAGGVVGRLINQEMQSAFGYLGTSLLFISVFLAGITLATGLSWFGLMDKLRHIFLKREDLLETQIKAFKTVCLFFKKRSKQDNMATLPSKRIAPVLAATSKSRAEPKVPVFIDSNVPRIQTKSQEVRVPTPKTSNSNSINNVTNTALPSVTLLEEASEAEQIKHNQSFSDLKLEALSREVEARLLEFGVQVTVVAVYPGPVITRFEIELAAGLKVSKITGLSKDLARALLVTKVRVVEVIPGKSVVGLEIPNEHRELVRLREILESNAYLESASPLSLALGKDISGEPIVVNLSKMPHLLVAGTTGSGKSVGVNVMLLSLLYKSTPKEVRLILIDPKMLELSIYDGIPHLLTPVVTDMKDAANALRWCVGEMERRYQVMAAVGVRNVLGFNRKIMEAEAEGKPLYHPLWRPEEGEERPVLTHLPYIVVIIDEFADMMMVVGKKVEELIARIAQKARAAGIHMILATQRPSVDVITGLIKANVPTRIAFQVSSRIDSRTILDQQGAEQLLGHGDMLYLAPGSGIPTRIHGAFVSDEEVHAVVRSLKQMGEPDYAEDILGGSSLSSGYGGFEMEEDGEQDDLYDEAVRIITETRRASISHLQRRLKVGYNRAARLIEIMEMAGVVSPMQSNGAREVLAAPPPE